MKYLVIQNKPLSKKRSMFLKLIVITKLNSTTPSSIEYFWLIKTNNGSDKCRGPMQIFNVYSTFCFKIHL